MADHTISLKAVAEGTTLTKVKVKSFEYEIDEPEFFGGRSLAPSPVDYLLGAVAGCIVAAGTQLAKDMGISLRRLQADVEGVIDSDCFFGIPTEKRSGFQKITINLTIDSDGTKEQTAYWKQQLMIRCPVIDNLLQPVEIVIIETENES